VTYTFAAWIFVVFAFFAKNEPLFGIASSRSFTLRCSFIEQRRVHRLMRWRIFRSRNSMSKKCTAFRKMCEAKSQWHSLNVRMSTIFIFGLVILLFGVDVNSRHESN
jgi:hypothetical protein